MKRLIAATVATLSLVLAGASIALIGGSSASQAVGTASEAFGLSAAGPIPVDKTPYVVSDDGKLHKDSVGESPHNPLFTGGLVTVSADNGEASATVSNLNVGRGLLAQLPEDLAAQLEPLCAALEDVPLSQVTGPITGPGGLLDPDALEEALDPLDQSGLDLGLVTDLDLSKLLPEELSGLCDVLAGRTGLVSAEAVTAECHGRDGSLVVDDLKALGLPLGIDTSTPNSKAEIPGVVTITANRQTTNPDGTFTVDGLVMNLFGQQEIIVTSATCGRYTRDDPTPAPTDSPTPVETNFPVTG